MRSSICSAWASTIVPRFFQDLLPSLLNLRLQTGRPYWIVIDETHHLLRSDWAPASVALPQQASGLMLITVHPDHVAPAMLASASTVIAIGDSPDQTIEDLCKTIGEGPPQVPSGKLKPGEAIVWHRQARSRPIVIRTTPPQAEHQRHVRKYAEGKLSDADAFYFRGPQGKVNLRAQNLMAFVELGEGVDDRTWSYHLKRGEYSSWFGEAIGDEELAKAAEEIERTPGISPEKSRALIRSVIEARYTAPS